MSIYNVAVIKKLLIYNPKSRPPLAIGEMMIDSNYVTAALQTSGMSLHSLEPFEILDKVGFLKTGDDAAELFLDALMEQVKNDVAAGAQYIHLNMDSDQ